MKQKLYIALIYLCLTPLLTKAQEPFLKSHISPGSYGSRNMNLFYQPKGGFVWLGSQEGLIRYDGQDYEVYNNRDSLSELKISAIYQDRHNKLWVGDRSGRIYYFNALDSLELWDPEEGLPNVAITGFAEDTQGNLWFSTYGEGAYYWNGRRMYNYDEEDGLPGLDIYDLAADGKGRIWVATDGGISICWIEEGEKKIKNVSRKEGLPDEIVRSILPDGMGNCWVGTYEEGLCFISGKDLEVKHLTQDWNLGPISCLEWVADRELWIGTEGKGLWRFQLDNQKLTPVEYENLAKAKIYNLHKDSEGNIWILSNHEGLLSTNYHFEFIREKIMHTQAILQDYTENLWIGTQEGLYQYTESSRENESFHQLSNENILSLYQDQFGNIWAGTFGNGVMIFEPESHKVKWLKEKDGLTNGSILSIDGSKDKIWLATLGGVTELNGRVNPLHTTDLLVRNLTHENGLGANFIYKVLVDSKNQTWFGTDGKGLSVLTGDELKNYSSAGEIPIKSVYSIAEGPDGHIWFSTAREGIFKFDGSQFFHFGTKEGLRDLNISALMADKGGKILIVHATGIDLLDPESGQFIYYDSEVGIEEIEPNLNALFRDDNDYIWIGAQEGIIRYLSLTEDLDLRPQLHLDNVSVNLKPIDINGQRAFNHRQNNLVFEYAGLWYSDPNAVSYHYFLEGFNQQWITSKDKRAVYSNLPPGEYTFFLSAGERNILPNEHALAYTFRIKAPFWQQNWFIVLAVFSMTGLIYLFIHIREQRLQLEAQLKKEKLEGQLEVLKSQINPHFLFNNFNTLIAVIEEEPVLAVEYVEKLSDFYRHILQYREKDTIPLAEEMSLVKNYFFLLKKRYGDNLNLKISTKNNPSAYLPPLSLQMLVENAVKHNIISHSQPLNIHISEGKDGYLVIQNNLQKKITPEKSTGFGLQSIRKRYTPLTSKKVMLEETKKYFRVSIPLISKV